MSKRREDEDLFPAMTRAAAEARASDRDLAWPEYLDVRKRIRRAAEVDKPALISRAMELATHHGFEPPTAPSEIDRVLAAGRASNCPHGLVIVPEDCWQCRQVHDAVKAVAGWVQRVAAAVTASGADHAEATDPVTGQRIYVRRSDGRPLNTAEATLEECVTAATRARKCEMAFDGLIALHTAAVKAAEERVRREAHTLGPCQNCGESEWVPVCVRCSCG